MSEKGASVQATVEASAEVLLLLLWRRTDLNDARVLVAGASHLVEELRSTQFAP